ncbi:catalytic domain alpha amylase [Toxoplasma gondii VAND]|uniref:Catalytic domain alpha amylase n=1 Tax=Toxoplasma gondii VAND TaxID=933077 RepID=A0A086QIJ7_TOXGO|nr:catalytic domain alpha amylase [Toxoplasma gondii VAND]
MAAAEEIGRLCPRHFLVNVLVLVLGPDFDRLAPAVASGAPGKAKWWTAERMTGREKEVKREQRNNRRQEAKEGKEEKKEKEGKEEKKEKEEKEERTHETEKTALTGRARDTTRKKSLGTGRAPREESLADGLRLDSVHSMPWDLLQELTHAVRSKHPSKILIAEVTPENPQICNSAGFDSCWIHSAYYDAIKVTRGQDGNHHLDMLRAMIDVHR